MRTMRETTTSTNTWRALRRVMAGGDADGVASDALAAAAIEGEVAALLSSMIPEMVPLLETTVEREIFVALHLDRALERGAEALERAGLPSPVLLKGIATANLVYDNPSHRVGVDVDILVEEEAFDPTLEALRQGGFLDATSASFTRTHGARAWEHEMAWQSEGGSVSLDVHRRLAASERFQIDHPGIARRALECENLPWPVSHPEDTLLHTALHMAANRFSVPLKSWVDVVRLLDDERVDLERVATRARTWRMATALWATLRVKARWFGEPAPVSVMRTLEPPWGVRRALELGLSGDGRWPVRGDARGSWSRLLYGPLLADDLAATWAWFRESAGQAKRMATGGNTR